MLIKITTRCQMGCKHCLGDYTEEGIDMNFDTLKLLCERINEFGPRTLIISGGEPTLHPNFKEYVEYIHNNIKKDTIIIICSNGLLLENEYEWISGIRYKYPLTHFQITNIPGLYPVNIDINSPIYTLSNVSLIRQLERIYPIGRAVKNSLSTSVKCSQCFNFRLVRAQLENKPDFSIHTLLECLEYHGKYCTMGVLPDGKIIMGESKLCTPYADITMSERDILYNMKHFKCGNCEHINKTRVSADIYEMIKKSES